MNRVACFLAGLLRDLTLERAELIKENAFLRAQLQAYTASVKRPRLDAQDRMVLVFLSKLVPRWREFLTIVKPDALVAWANEGYRAFWSFSFTTAMGTSAACSMKSLATRASKSSA